MTDRFFFDEHNGWVYVKVYSYHWMKPEQHIFWWPTGVRLYDVAQRLGSHEEARALIGTQMREVSRFQYQAANGMVFGMRDGGQTKADPDLGVIVEEVKPPKQRGKALPVEWRDGAWQKRTRDGWRLA